MSERHTIDLDPAEVEPKPRQPWWGWVIDRNPLFLLSGVMMLVGCFLVSQEIHALDPADVGEDVVLHLVIALLVVINLYEFAVIGLGLWLSKTRTLARDTRHLLGIALLLMIDIGFVYNESGIFAPQTGAVIAVIATVLACIKIGLILWWLGMTPSILAVGVLAVSFGSIYALPVVVRLAAGDGFLDPIQAMAIWAGVGGVVALQALPARWIKINPARSDDVRQLQRLIVAGLMVLPSLSLIGHAAGALWVYENAFDPSMLSPILLGLAAVILRQHRLLGGGQPSLQAATLIIASAIVAAMLPGDELIYESAQFTWLAFSPLRAVLLICPPLLIWGWWISDRRAIGLVNTCMPIFAASLGHTPGAMFDHFGWLISLSYSQLPSTRLQWGITAIASAFGLLLAGAILSRWHRYKSSRDLA